MRSLVVITPPAAAPVSLAEAKAQLQVTDSSQDTVITALIAVAAAALDGPDGWLGRALMPQVLELQIDRLPYAFDSVLLPCQPIVSVSSITYMDTQGVDQTLDPSFYTLSGNRVLRAFGKAWPAVHQCHGAVRVRYSAGYADAAAVPAPIRQAIILMVKQAFEMISRNSFVSSDRVDGVSSISYFAEGSATLQNAAVDSLLAPYRVHL